MIKLANINECTGCKACMTTCGRNAISFEYDNSTLHYYPVVDKTKCVECGRCISKCPALNINVIKQTRNDYHTKSFCAWNNNEEERHNSTSGGLGMAISKWAISLHYLVVGAAFDQHWYLSHSIATNESEISRFCGSKYLISDMAPALSEIVKRIKEGENVLFIGTPCQCEAVKAVVPSSHQDNVITCSIICHGVNSALVWEDYVAFLEKKYKSKLMSYNFRSKCKGWGKLFVSYSFENNKRLVERARVNIFHSWFGHHYMLRPSCFKCSYRTRERFTDLVIGDFWGIDQVISDLDTSEGVSVLIVNSSKGENFIQGCESINLIETNFEKTISVLKGFISSQTYEDISIETENAKKFAVDYNNMSFEKMAKTYKPESLFKSIVVFIKSTLSRLYE